MNQVDNDIHVRNFARVLATLEPHLPISDQYELDVPQKQGVWWSSQQEYMVRWFSDQVTRGSGVFTRAEPNASAQVCSAATCLGARSLSCRKVA